MGIFNGCLITSDVDDTLVASGFIHPKNIEKIEFFMNEGGMFSVATGRSANAIGTVTAAIKRFSPSVVANGCMIYDYERQKIIYSKTIPKEDHKLLKMVIENGIDVGCEVHSGIEAFTVLRNSETDFHQLYEGFEAPLCDFKDIYDLDWNKVVFFTENTDLFDEIINLAKEIGIKSSLISTGMNANGVKHSFLEIVPNGISKATAINKLCEIYKIKKGNWFAIGDYYNDVPMLKSADISAATNGAPEDIKQMTDYVTVDCKDGAVADFIDYLTSIYSKN